jgi:hypothetical protein
VTFPLRDGWPNCMWLPLVDSCTQPAPSINFIKSRYVIPESTPKAPRPTWLPDNRHHRE